MTVLPVSDYDINKGRNSTAIAEDKVTVIQVYEDGTVTIVFDNGVSMKFGPYDEPVLNDLLEELYCEEKKHEQEA